MRLRPQAVAVIATIAIGCAETTPPATTDTTDVTLPDTAYSPQAAVARFGRYKVDPTPDVVRPTATPDGEFVVVSANPSGHRVGRVGGRLAIWPADASAPTYMFRPDTTLANLLQAVISDRLEVVMVLGEAHSNSTYAWRANELKTIQLGGCANGIMVNARGMIGRNSQCSLYPSGGVSFSPFDPDVTRSGRWGSGASCGFGGRYSRAVAIDDENDALIYGEYQPAGGAGYRAVGGGAGCTDIPTFGYNFYLSWTSLRAGLIGGTNSSSEGPIEGLLTDGVHLGRVNDLLTAATAAEWRILGVQRIDSGKTLVCQAVSLVDGHKATIRLIPDA